MQENELHKLGKTDLLTIIYEQEKQIEQLKKDVKDLNEQLEDRTIKIKEAGSIADASMKINKIFEVAQQAADEYLRSIKEVNKVSQESAKLEENITNDEISKETIKQEKIEDKNTEEIIEKNINEETDKLNSHKELNQLILINKSISKIKPKLIKRIAIFFVQLKEKVKILTTSIRSNLLFKKQELQKDLKQKNLKIFKSKEKSEKESKEKIPKNEKVEKNSSKVSKKDFKNIIKERIEKIGLKAKREKELEPEKSRNTRNNEKQTKNIKTKKNEKETKNKKEPKNEKELKNKKGLKDKKEDKNKSKKESKDKEKKFTFSFLKKLKFDAKNVKISLQDLEKETKNKTKSKIKKAQKDKKTDKNKSKKESKDKEKKFTFSFLKKPKFDVKNVKISLQDLEKELKRRKEKANKAKFVRTITFSSIVIIAFAIIASTRIFNVLQVSGNSMEPSLYSGDLLISTKIFGYEKGDIIAFYYNNSILIKRIIATEGDIVYMDDEGNVYVNSKKLDEDYIQELAYGNCDITFPYKVPDKEVFVLGDNRQISVDSRSKSIGTVSDEKILGKITMNIKQFLFY